jgi:predicted AAA+ superfamily ATPase
MDDRTKVLIRDYNPWWVDKKIEVPEYKRELYPRLQKYLKTKQIIAIVGLRRVGKTVLMKQLIKDLVKKEKKNVFYFLFDELVTQNPEVLEDVINYYLKTTAKNGRKYIFLDEIQKVPYWRDILKRFYDTREDIKFMVSGSASLEIKKSKESLAGRIFDFHLPILSFREFLEMSGREIEETDLEFSEMERVYERNIHNKPVLENLFLQYILKGGFPEIVGEDDDEIIKNYIKSSVLEKIIYEDIPAVFNIRRKDILYSILEYCSKETSNLLDITKLADMLEVNYQTAKTYVFYLQNSFVIDILYNHSKSIAKQLRKNKKVHIAHPSITITVMRYSREILDVNEVVSKYVESIVFQHSKTLCERLSFWRTPQKDEVDILLQEDTILPVEVKYKSRVDGRDLRSMLKLLDKFKLGRGFIVTKSTFRREEVDGREIIFIPVWLFLLCRGI